MRRLSVSCVACAVFLAVPRPLADTPQHIELKNPAPITHYEARVSRTKPRAVMTLTQLPAKWQRLAWCESRHHLHANNNNTYYGLWQIHKGWYKPFGINPTTATIAQQYKVARHVYKTQGARAWTCSRKSNFN